MQIHPEIEREALHIARRMVRDAVKANGIRLSQIDPQDITKAAKVLIRHPDCQEIIHFAWGVCKMRYEALRS
jgi:hypothetical protein